MLLSVGGQMLPVLISHRHKKALLRVVILGTLLHTGTAKAIL